MTYAQLVAQIGDWLGRADMASLAPTLVELAEERFNRVLRLNAFSDVQTITVATGTAFATLPADYLEGRALVSDGDDWQQVTPEKLAQLKSYGSTDAYFSIFGGKVHIPYTADADIDFSLSYWTKVVPLTASNTTNWISLNHPGAYLWACLSEAAIYTVDPKMGSVYETRALQAIADLQASERAAAYFAGSITDAYVV